MGLGQLPPPTRETAFSRAVRQARRGPVQRKVPVELAAAVRGRVRKWPALAVNAILLFVAADLAGSFYLREAMGVKLLDQYRANLIPPSQSLVTDQTGRRVGVLAASDAVREPLENIPIVFKDALVRMEDKRFYAHDGVDRERLVGAVKALLYGSAQGGSTLSMQLAKMIKKDSARTLRRKLEDIALALALDDRLGKDEVLKLYSNQAYFGSGVYGLSQACRFYFEKEKCEGLTVEEAAYLVSLLRAPADLARDPDRAINRRNLVIDQLRDPEPPPGTNRFEQFSRRLYLAAHDLKEHKIGGVSKLIGHYTHEMLDQAKRQPLDLARNRIPAAHPFVLETARQELQKKLGSTIYQDGLEIRLTIDSEVQRAAEDALTAGLNNLRELRKKMGRDTPPDLDGGVVVVNPRTGHLLAYVPGADFSKSQVPFAARPIQVGSSMKPFIYGELFEQGKGDLDTYFADAPICIGGWCPKNYDHKYRGAVTVQYALSHSLNTVAVRVADTVGVDGIAARLRLMGVSSPITANLPMALGASDLTLLELGGLYSTLYDGRTQRPRLVLDVRDREGKVLYGGDEPLRARVYKPSTIEQLHTAMGAVMAPGGTAAVVARELEAYFGVPAGKHLGEVPGLTPQFACKTGTHDGFTRVGLGCVISDTDFGPVAIVAYVGHRLPKNLGEGLTGGRVAGPIVQELVKAMTVRTRAGGFFRRFPDIEPERPHGRPIYEDDSGKRLVEKEEKADEKVTALQEKQKLAALEAWKIRDERDPSRAAFVYARASMAGPEDPRMEQATIVLPTGIGAPTLPPSSEAKQIIPAMATNTLPRLSAPRDWPGLRVLDTDVVEASGEEIIQSFLDNGGREEELAELAPLLEMGIERRVIHEHRLLQPGFTDRPLSERFVQLFDKVSASMKRMLTTKRIVTKYEHPDERTHILSEADADRRIERVYRFSSPPQMFRVTRHHTSGQLLSLEWIDEEGKRRAMVRRGERMAPLTMRRVVVKAGSLEPAWIAGGMSPSQLDGLRALIGGSMSIDRIPRGFKLDLLLADGGLIGVEAEIPNTQWQKGQKASGIRTETACLSHDGIPCGRRLMPLPLAEARLYGKRASGDSGAVMIQKDLPGASVATPMAGRVLVSDDDRNQVIVQSNDGRTMTFDGVHPSVAIGAELALGAPVGKLDPRGVLVFRATEKREGRFVTADANEQLPQLGGADESLRGVSNWWSDLHAWLRGDRPALRRPVQRAEMAARPTAATEAKAQ